MEIKTVGELIPYRASLKELWGKEEFQPVLALLNSLKQEAIDGVRALEIKEGFATGVRISSLKTQLNLANLFVNLPDVIKDVEDNQERIGQKIAQMKKAQEGAEV